MDNNNIKTLKKIISSNNNNETTNKLNTPTKTTENFINNNNNIPTTDDNGRKSWSSDKTFSSNSPNMNISSNSVLNNNASTSSFHFDNLAQNASSNNSLPGLTIENNDEKCILQNAFYNRSNPLLVVKQQERGRTRHHVVNGRSNIQQNGVKRKLGATEFGRFSNSNATTNLGFQQKLLPATNQRTYNNILPTFIASVPELLKNVQTPKPIMAAPPTSSSSEFATPTHHAKKLSRPNSPSSSSLRIQSAALASHGRIASIRRESDCSVENEAAHEKFIKTTQQVSIGFDDFCLDEKLFEERKRAKSLTEPISIFTNAFLPHSSSPSPTRCVDQQKQCYSPSTQQMVRCNISYSPSPSPTPSSPTRNRIMRSMSPIAVRQISKRRYTGSGNGSGLESDGESSLNGYVPTKRQCTTPRSAASPLVRDSLTGPSQLFLPNDLSVNSFSANFNFSTNSINSNFDEQQLIDEDSSIQYRLFCSGSINNDNNSSSTTFSSRANTPIEEPLNETELGSIPSNNSSLASLTKNESSSNLSEDLSSFTFPITTTTTTTLSSSSSRITTSNFSIANVLLPPPPVPSQLGIEENEQIKTQVTKN